MNRPKDVATRFVAEYLNTADERLLGELTIDGYTDHDLPPGMTPQQSISAFRTGFPDARFEVRDVVGEGDKVVVRYGVSGTHTGEFFGFPPTDKQVHIEGMSMYRVRGDRLAEAWVQYDKAGIAQQIGMT